MKTSKHWSRYLWVASALYLMLGFFNIMFAWLGLICFAVPIFMALFGKDKAYCNQYCGRGQLFDLLGRKLGLSCGRPTPKFLTSKIFRYGFLIFFFAMFFNMLFQTSLVFSGVKTLSQVVTVLWSFQLPWQWAYHGTVLSPGVAAFAFGFYSVMLTSTLLGFVSMLLFKPRSWCVYCPMGTTTQLICKAKYRGQ